MRLPVAGHRPDHRAGVELAAIDPHRAAEAAADLECRLDYGVAGQASSRALYAKLAQDPARNDLIFDDILSALEDGRSPVGLLFSHATPEIGARLQLVSAVLPLPIIEASHFIGSVIGVLLLLYVCAGDYRVRRRDRNAQPGAGRALRASVQLYRS